MDATILQQLDQMVAQRKQHLTADTSYVAKLLSGSPDAVLKKIAEESGEVLLAAKDGDPKQIIYEVADLWFHIIVMLGHYDLSTDDVLSELKRRQGTSGITEKKQRGGND